MKTFNVTAHVTVEVTYEVKANSRVEALVKCGGTKEQWADRLTRGVIVGVESKGVKPA